MSNKQDSLNSKEIKRVLQLLNTDDMEPCLQSLMDKIKTEEIASKINPILGASYFSGLLFSPQFSSNCFRIESLIHLLLSAGTGTENINFLQARKLFSICNDTAFERTEDPSEDVMVNKVFYNHSEYLILEGLWESNSFYLQRFLNILSKMPNEKKFITLKNRISTLLKISDYLIKRANLNPFLVGNLDVEKIIPVDELFKVEIIQGNCILNLTDLSKIGIVEKDLQGLLFPLERRNELIQKKLGTTLLEEKILVKKGNLYYILLPTAIGFAIKTMILDFSNNISRLEVLNKSIQFEYFELFKEPLHKFIPDVSIEVLVNDIHDVWGAQLCYEFDKNRFINIIFIFDSLNQYFESEVKGTIEKGYLTLLNDKILSISKQHLEFDKYNSGVSLVVSCSWECFPLKTLPITNNKKWLIEYVSAPDFIDLINYPSFDIYKLWQLVQAKNQLNFLNTEIFNFSGLLNLFAWSQQNNSNLIPHDDLPRDLPRDLTCSNHSLMIPLKNNLLLDIRKCTYNTLNFHYSKDKEVSKNILARLKQDSFFDEDLFLPIYYSQKDVNSGVFLSCVEGEYFRLWITPILSGKNDKSFVFDFWMGLSNWVYKLDLLIFKYIHPSFKGYIKWQIHFDNFIIPKKISSEVLNYYLLRDKIKTNFSKNEEELLINTFFPDEFVSSLYQEFNDSERATIYGLIKTILIAFEVEEVDKITDIILQSLFKNKFSKYCHLFPTIEYRDYFKDSLQNPICLDSFDLAMVRNELGRELLNDSNILMYEGIKKCTTLLNNIIDKLIEKLGLFLRIFNKALTINTLLNNYEASESELDRWKITFNANMGTHNDKEATRKQINEEIFNLTSAALYSRLGVEFAICECAKKQGRVPGKIDICRIFSYLSLIFNYGNLSDQIMYGMVKPKIQLSIAGDVLFNQDSFDNVIIPFGSQMQTILIENTIRIKSKQFVQIDNNFNIVESVGKEFCRLWFDEYGFSIEFAISFIEILENLGIKNESLIFNMSKVNLITLALDKGLSDIETLSFLSAFSIIERSSFIDIPNGYFQNDIFPWKFQRKLSLLTKPIIFLKDEYIISPSLIRQSCSYIIDSSYNAVFDENHFSSIGMQKWIGNKRRINGLDFNNKVAKELNKYGWKTYCEKELSWLLNKKMDKNYGDIDVLALNPRNGNLMIIECKKLYFAKTPGEIAKKLSNFQGKMKLNDKGKKDLLLKHMERIKKINDNMDLLKKNKEFKNVQKILPCILFSKKTPMSYVSTIKENGIEVLEFGDLSQLNI